MSEAHRPSAAGKSVWGILLELVLISVAVFVGLLADGWRETRQHRELARNALRNFRTEIAINRDRINGSREYHVKLLAYVKHELYPDVPGPANFKMHGIAPVVFERTAWELAIATQALSYVDSDIALEIARVYTRQAAFQRYEETYLGAAFAPVSMASGTKPILQSLEGYLGDVVITEPGLLKDYEAVLPRLTAALADVPSEAAAPK